MSPDPAAALARLRVLAMAMPAAAEKVSQGQATFFIEGGKVFAYFTHDHHNDGRTAVLVKTTGLDEQATLIDLDPDLYFRPAYIGHRGWIGIRVDGGEVDWDHVGDRIARSWELVAPRRLLEAGGR